MDIASAAPARGQVAAADGFEPVTVVEGDPASGLIVVCDHAGNRLPAEYGDLGLSPVEFSRHIAYDPGAAAVSRGLAARINAPAALCNFSRLLIDPNRGIDDPTLIMRLSDGSIIPGNYRVDAAERARRIAAYYAPYHAAVDDLIDQALATGRAPALVSIHSFTPVWRGHPRPWHAGILWDKDRRLAEPLIAALRSDPTLIIGDNEPYSGALANDSMDRHGTQRGVAHVLVEIRQDLISDDAGADIWAEKLAAILGDLCRRADVGVVIGNNASAPR